MKNRKHKFVRYGGLNALKQGHYETYDSEKTFHNPPVKRGFYAFSYPYIDYFMLGATNEPSHISGKSQWLKDSDGNKVKEDDFYDVNSEYDDQLGRRKVYKKWAIFLRKNKIKLKHIQSCYVEKVDAHCMTILKRPHIFLYEGEIWHHLDYYLKPEHIIETKGSWVKTTMEDYKLALKLDLKGNVRSSHKSSQGWGFNFKDMIKGKQDPYKGNGVNYSQDHLEVFIEKV